MDRFERVRTQVLGLSIDSIPCLQAWAESLGDITFPLMSDFYPHGEVAKNYGVLRAEGCSERAIFVIDKRGIIRYVDVHDFDDQPDNEVLFRVLEEVEPKPVAVSTTHKTVTEPEPLPEPEADVIMYCTPWCPACRKARAYLNELGVEFMEVDITRDREAAKHLRTWTGGYETTPTFRVKGEIVVNFDKTKLAEALGVGKN